MSTRAAAGRPYLTASAVLLAAVLALGWLFAGALVRYGQGLADQDVHTIAETAAAALDPVLVGRLDGDPDNVSASFRRIREVLARIRGANPEVRFAYLMRVRDGAVIFLADSEPEASDDYSPPGQVYDGLTTGILQVLEGGDTVVEAAYEDDWGRWVSGLSPVLEPTTGRPIAVLGIDISAERWAGEVSRYRWFAWSVVGLVAGIVLLGHAALVRERWMRERVGILNRELRRELGERKRAEDGLRMAASVFDSTAEGIMITRPDWTIESVNPAFERITGFRAEDVLGQTPALLKHDDSADDHRNTIILDELRKQGSWQGEFWSKRKDGTPFCQEMTVDALRDEQGEVTHYAVVFSDSTRQRELEKRLVELSRTDPLTRLANRRAFDEALEAEWRRARRGGSTLAVAIVDVDRFKQFNDLLGHQAGDGCLQRVATTLAASSRRAGDLVARYGGEEFAVLLPATDLSAARKLAEDMRRDIEALQIPSGDGKRLVTVSVGVAAADATLEDTQEALVARADRALYRAKAEGRNRIAWER